MFNFANKPKNILNMKKLFLLFTFVLSVMSAYAKDPMWVESGSLECLTDPNKTVLFEVDYTNTIAHNDDNRYTLEEYLEHRGPDHVRDWDSSKGKAESFIPMQFNKKNKKGAQALLKEEKSDILGTIYIDDLDFGNASGVNPFSSIKAGGCIITGKIVFTDVNNDNSVLAVVPFNDIKGYPHVSETSRLGLAYCELMGKLSNVIKNEAKKKKK